MQTYIFWNNKGGTGKTSIAFQVACLYANKNPSQRILILDICPQANLSELFLGGLTGGGSPNLLQCQGMIPRCSIGGYFEKRLLSPYSVPNFECSEFITKPNNFNSAIPNNIDLVCGDPLLELQANFVNALASTQSPVTDTWIGIIMWIKDFLDKTTGYDVVFIDSNPSFSIYTQIALAAATRIILPVMADDSSRRAIQNAFSLIYGLKLPSEIYSTYAFANKLQVAKKPLPKVHLIVKNRITQYMGSASAYAEVFKSIETDVKSLQIGHSELFATESQDLFVDIRDFQTTGVVAFSKGSPFYNLKTGYLTILDRRIQVNRDNLKNCIDSVEGLVEKL